MSSIAPINSLPKGPIGSNKDHPNNIKLSKELINSIVMAMLFSRDRKRAFKILKATPGITPAIYCEIKQTVREVKRVEKHVDSELEGPETFWDCHEYSPGFHPLLP